MSRFVCLAMILLLSAAIAVSAKPHEVYNKELAGQKAQECKTETGATDEEVESMMKHEPADSHESKCLRACMMKKFSFMDDAGKLSKEHALELVKLMSKDDADKEAAGAEIIDTCETIEVPEDHCDAAVAYQSCFLEHMQEHGLALDEH
ncbi:general odorant-binding protein 19d [Drosophila grimshawi]|uniref:GH17930 n=1 Tax=Drosophila grimshawi TaxID=7222 RepID=B4JXD4_DROGR|nr:general odorant-binding protein 19d [Drosophila grimshawi]EDV95410.1 GH17930 [Drosophila grimshawi]